MTLQLSSPPVGYSREDQAQLRAALQKTDAENYKKGADLELGFVRNSAGVLVPSRLILRDEVTGERMNIRLVSGALTPTVLP